MTVDVTHLIDRVPDDVLGMCRRLREAGHKGWIVGGCVRDMLRGTDAKDWDIATDARPEQIMRLFRKVIPTGIQHGTVTVLLRGVPYEVTTLRGESSYSDGRRPDRVEFTGDITADLARRDFTFNAIAIDPVDGHIIDPFGGQQDLQARVVRAVGDPAERFAEDGLRVLRAARFAATLQCVIDPETERAMGSERALATYQRVSPERVREEWQKSILAPRPSVAFEIMRKTSILFVTCPELLEAVGCEQNRWHAFDVWGHVMACLDACKPEPVLRMAALLHDVAKPRTRALSEKTNDYTFYEHERVGAEMADSILARLRFSNEERARIAALVRHHLICYSDDWTDAAVRRWLRRVSVDLAPDLYALGIADALGKGRDVTAEIAGLQRLQMRASRILEQGAALSIKDLAVNGHDLMKQLNLTPGPIIGQILERLIEVVTDDPLANEAPRLLAEARRFIDSRGPACD